MTNALALQHNKKEGKYMICTILHNLSHNLTLPADINVVIKQNFIYRMLFTDIY